MTSEQQERSGWSWHHPLWGVGVAHHHCDPKIAQDRLIVRANQDVLRLHIAVNHMLLVRVVQGCRDFLDQRDDSWQRQASTSGIALSQRAFGGITHRHKGDVILYPEVEEPHDTRVLQSMNSMGFLAKLVKLRAGQTGVEDFNGGGRVQVLMLTQIDLREPAFTDQLLEIIVANVSPQVFPCWFVHSSPP